MSLPSDRQFHNFIRCTTDMLHVHLYAYNSLISAQSALLNHLISSWTNLKLNVVVMSLFLFLPPLPPPIPAVCSSHVVRGSCGRSSCQCLSGYTGNDCCVCASGYIRDGSRCTTCPTGTVPDTTQRKCICDQSQGRKSLVNGKCIGKYANWKENAYFN